MAYTYSDKRVNPITGAISSRALDPEVHTIAELANLPGVYGVQLKDGIVQGTLTVTENVTGGAVFVQVTTAPLAGQVGVTYSGGINKRGLLLFNVADAGTEVVVDYDGVGSVNSIENVQAMIDETITADVPALADTEINSLVPTMISDALSGISVLRGYVDGFITAPNATHPTYQIDTGAGVIADTTATVYLRLASTIVKSLNASWAVGSGNGGLDTGSIAATTWYYMFIIERPDTEVVDVLWSASATSPTMPTSYTLRSAPIAAVVTDGSSNITGYTQVGDEFWFNDTQVPVNGVSISTSGALYTLAGPTGIASRAIGVVSPGRGAASNTLAISMDTPAANYQLPASHPVLGAFRGVVGGYTASDNSFLYSSSSYFVLLTNSSGQVKMRRTGSYFDATTYTTVQQKAFILARGRNA